MSLGYVLSGAALVVSVGAAIFNYWHTERRFRATTFPVVDPLFFPYIRPGYWIAATVFRAGMSNVSDRGPLLHPSLRVYVRDLASLGHRRRATSILFHSGELPTIQPGKDEWDDFPDANKEIGEFERFLERHFPHMIKSVELPNEADNGALSLSYQVPQSIRIEMTVILEYGVSIYGEKRQRMENTYILTPVLEEIDGTPGVLRKWKVLGG